MIKEFNSNLLFPNDKNWLETVNENFDERIITWVGAQKRGELKTEDIIKVAEKIAKLRNDNGLVDGIKQRMGLTI